MSEQSISSNELLIEIIEQIYSARHAIAISYDNRGAQFDDDTADKLMPLVKNFLMKKTGHNTFTLRQRFRELFDTPLGRYKIASFDTNLSDWVGRIQINMQRLRESSIYRPEDRANILSEIAENISDIRDTLEDAADKLHHKTDVNFGLLSMSKSKRAENKLYIESIDKLLSSYSEVDRLFSSEEFHEDSDISEIISVLPIYCMPIISKLTNINDRLREFMFKQRQIELQAAKIKALIQHINDHPGFKPENALDKAHQLEQAKLFEPITTKLMPDLTDGMASEYFGPMIQDIQTRIKDNPEKVKREGSSLRELQLRDELVEPSLVEKTVLKMMISSYQESKPIQVTLFWHQNKLKQVCGLTEFIFETVSFFDKNPKYGKKPLAHYINRHLALTDVDGFTGNKYLNDVYIYPTKMSKVSALRLLGVG